MRLLTAGLFVVSLGAMLPGQTPARPDRFSTDRVHLMQRRFPPDLYSYGTSAAKAETPPCTYPSLVTSKDLPIKRCAPAAPKIRLFPSRKPSKGLSTF